jgi:hypothetical protein
VRRALGIYALGAWLDAEFVGELTERTRNPSDPVAPGCDRLAPAGELRIVARGKAALDGMVAGEEPPPGADVAGVDALERRRAGPVGPDAREVGADAGAAVRDLMPDLGLVDEVRCEDPLECARGLALDRRPLLQVL